MGTACPSGRWALALLLSQADLCHSASPQTRQLSQEQSQARQREPVSSTVPPPKLGHFSGNPTGRDSTQQFSKVKTTTESHFAVVHPGLHSGVPMKLGGSCQPSNECFCWQLFPVSKKHQYNQCSPKLLPGTVPAPCPDLHSWEDRAVRSSGRAHQDIWECTCFSQPCLQISRKWIKWVFYWQCSH